MIHSRTIIDWYVTVSWIPSATTSFRIWTCIHTEYWEDNCIWFNNTNLLKQAHYLAFNLEPEFNVSFCLFSLFLSLAPSFPPSPPLIPALFLSVSLWNHGQVAVVQLPPLLQFERWLHGNNSPWALYSIISDFWGLCATYCPWDRVTEMTENSHKSGLPKNRAAPQWLSSHCALLPIRDA